MDDLVSIVLPTYNGEEYISLAIDSILAQEYENWELIVINDCSSDGTEDLVLEYLDKDKRIKLFNNQSNYKLPKSLNKGFSESRGKYLTWTSDDNILEPFFISRMLEEIKIRGCDFVYSNYYQIDSKNEIIQKVYVLDKSYILESNVVGASFMYTRDVYNRVGAYDDDLFLMEDYDYWIRTCTSFKIYRINEFLYRYRVHTSSLTARKHKEIARATINYMIKNYEKHSELFPEKALNRGLAVVAYRSLCIRSPNLFLKILILGLKKDALGFLLGFLDKVYRKIFMKWNGR